MTKISQVQDDLNIEGALSTDKTNCYLQIISTDNTQWNSSFKEQKLRQLGFPNDLSIQYYHSHTLA